MDVSILNEHILRYVRTDKTHSAIMLTGGWGTGKSFYIQNTLIPFLKANSIKCATLSLYGLNTLTEVSKCLYLEIRARFLPDSEAFIAGKTLAKTVLKGATSAFNITISPDKDDLEKLYKSIDLSGKLIILEDIERSHISIFDILGYVNSLVDQDNVKVLLVSNEDEFINYIYVKQDNAVYTSDVKEYTIETKKYLSVKEKTISDTIKWTGNIREALPDIIKSFGEVSLSKFATSDLLENLIQLLSPFTGVSSYSNSLNLRTFSFACQKTCDIILRLSKQDKSNIPELDLKYLKCIFFSIVIFSYRIEKGVIPKWNGSKYLSPSLGSNEFPLFHFCYNYIKHHCFNENDISPTLTAYDEYCIYDVRSKMYDPDISVIEYFYISSESKVKNALSNINARLNNNDIPLYYYSKIAVYLIKLHTAIGYNYEEIKDKMIINCLLVTTSIDVDMIFPSVDFENSNESLQYERFRNDIIRSIEFFYRPSIPEFDYSPNNLNSFSDKVISCKAAIQREGYFISRYDDKKMVDMLTRCSAEHIFTFRNILISVYLHSGPDSYSNSDCETFISILAQINYALKKEIFSSDKIIRFQIGLLCDDIKKYISLLL